MQITVTNMKGVPAVSSRRKFLQCIALYVPVFFLVYTATNNRNPNQLHRSTASSYVEANERFQLTLTGIEARKPNLAEIRYLEHTLFTYLNKALTPRKLQISLIEIDIDKTILKDISSQSAFTVVSTTTASVSMNRRKDEMFGPQDLGESDYKERELLQQSQKGSSANKLFVEVVATGRDYSMLEGRFKNSVKMAINVGHKGLIEMLVSPAQSEEYFKGVSWIGAVIIPSTAAASRGQNVNKHDDTDESAQRDPADLFNMGIQGETEQDSTSTSPNDFLSEGGEKEKSVKPMHARAARFRTISGSIFISFCITVVLVNTLRVANRKREERKRRMTKAKQAYEGPKEAVTSKRVSERFVGMLDDGAIPTR